MATSRRTTSHRYFFAIFIFIAIYSVQSASLDGRDGLKKQVGRGKAPVDFGDNGRAALNRVVRPTAVIRNDVDQHDQKLNIAGFQPNGGQNVPIGNQNNRGNAAINVPVVNHGALHRNAGVRPQQGQGPGQNVEYNFKDDQQKLKMQQGARGVAKFDQHQDGGTPVDMSESIKSNKPTPIKIAENPDCANDVKRLCSEKVAENNFAILDCLQHDFKTETDVNKKCQNFIWHYKKNLTLDIRFDSATTEVCNKDLEKITECASLQKGQGHVIPCLVDNKEKVTDESCKMFLKKMASIVFADYRLIYKFAEKCATDINKLECGRLHPDSEDATHRQGKTLECLSSKTDQLSPECKHEILRVAELQSDDYHMDRPLFFACREARESFCDKVSSGGGKVFKCLYKHKFDKAMTPECREQLVRRQKLMHDDYRVNRGFANKCDADIKQHKCLEGDVPGYDKGKLAHVLICLEAATRDGEDVEAGCLQEMRDMRKSLMSDYQISPEIVKECSNEINEHCGKLHRNGKTLHCLMKLAKPMMEPPDPNADAHDFPGHLGKKCFTALEDLIEEADPGEDYHTDPTLEEACSAVVDMACKDVKPGEGKILGCLMEHVGTDKMNTECEVRLLELQYFISRDFRLDYSLYKQCHKDASKLCKAPENWHDESTKPEMGPIVFNCLYGLMRQDSTEKELQVSRGCSFEIRRVMINRAKKVELNPDIQIPCLHDLSQMCSDDIGKGEEIQCLQEHLTELKSECQEAISKFTEDEDVMPELDRLLIKACTPMIKQFCQDEMEEDETEAGDIMECLIEHKNHKMMNDDCKAGIHHHQLISLKDYHFSHKFKEACKDTVVHHCDGLKTKADVVRCLSEMVRADTLKKNKHRVIKACRDKLRFELLQREENLEFDIPLKDACKRDLEKFCKNVTPGKAARLECLKKNQDQLSDECHKKVFKREKLEAVDNAIDYKLVTDCKRMIRKYCHNEDPSDILECLKSFHEESEFDEKCLRVILSREEIQNKDYRLNVDLQEACNSDIQKYCREIVEEADDAEELHGRVITCLRIKFSQKKLNQNCRNHIGELIKDSAIDYKQDPQLVAACQKEIKSMCLEEVASKNEPLDDRGKVEECLKMKLAEGKITNENCQREIARILAESVADIQVDPLLHKACSLDLKHYCADVSLGEGRQMSCLLSALEQTSKVRLKPMCEKMIRERKEMWEHAAKVAPPETFNELSFEILSSPSKNYFLGTIFAVIGVIFIGGLFCGRVTKRYVENDKQYAYIGEKTKLLI